MTPGSRNLITDVAGLRVGNAEDQQIKTGVTVLTADAPFVAAMRQLQDRRLVSGITYIGLGVTAALSGRPE